MTRVRLNSIMGRRVGAGYRAVYVANRADDAGYHVRPFDPVAEAWGPEEWIAAEDLVELPHGNPVLREALAHRSLLFRRKVAA